MATESYQLCTTILLVSTIVIWQPDLCCGTDKYSERDAADFLKHINYENSIWANHVAQAVWNTMTNLSEINAKQSVLINAEYGKYLRTVVNETQKFPWTTYKDPMIRRQFKFLSSLGGAGIPKEKLEKYNRHMWMMKSTYTNATLPDYENSEIYRRYGGMDKYIDLHQLMAKCTDEEELKHLWKQWRDVSGKKIRKFFPEYVRMFNENAKSINYRNAAEFWTKKFEVDNFREKVEHLWEQIKPLYLNLFAYVRRRLWLHYGHRVVQRRGPIPVHILGSVWGQTWVSLSKFILPFRKVGFTPMTKELLKKGYTVSRMFMNADEYYKSLGFSSLPKSFWKKSIFEQPKDRTIMCQPEAWDFCDQEDYRIKQCAEVTYFDFLTAHKLIGRIHYAIQYKNQPHIFRNGAFEGFQETVGEGITLSVAAPGHLHRLGLLPNSSYSFEADINNLYRVAMFKIPFMSFALVLDLWRWDVFNGTTTEENYNCDFWDLRYKYQGYIPPVVRTEKDFDPGSKMHIVGSISYLKFFLGSIMQYQLLQGLCEKIGEFDPNNPNSKPLHECDLYNSKKAGNLLKKMMKLGRSKHWAETIKIVTGTMDIDGTSLMNYFKPLLKWLEKKNDETGELLGWRWDDTMCIRANA